MKGKWNIEKVVGKRKFYARVSRSEIIVRVENDGDTSKYAEWGYPKVFGLEASIDQAGLDTKDSDIKP